MHFSCLFCIFAVLEMFASERGQKMLKNEVLDVQKLVDTAENEPLQLPEIWKTVGSLRVLCLLQCETDFLHDVRFQTCHEIIRSILLRLLESQ